MRRETSRVSFLMCPFCVRAVLSRCETDNHRNATRPCWLDECSIRGGPSVVIGRPLLDAEHGLWLLRERPLLAFGALDGACHLDA
jgi:hypothetical protein